ncbi:MAG: GAF domain-containing protein [Caldilineaceae bacterium]
MLNEDTPNIVGTDVIEDGTHFRIRAYGIPQLLPAFRPLLNAWPLTGNDEGEAFGTSGDLYRHELERRVQKVEENLGHPLGQVLGLPLLFEDEVLGVIFLFRGDNAFTQLDWQFLQGFAYQAAIAVRNARLYQQLSTERSRLATIVENSANGIMILSPDRHVQVINQALAAMTGMRRTRPSASRVTRSCNCKTSPAITCAAKTANSSSTPRPACAVRAISFALAVDTFRWPSPTRRSPTRTINWSTSSPTSSISRVFVKKRR